MSYELTIEPIGQTIEVEDGQTILDAALRAGIYLPHACCHGLCATCKVQVVDGEVDHGEASSFALMDFERDEGKTLACCARCESDVTIEAEIDEEPDAESIPVRDFKGTVSRIEKLTPTIKGIFIKLDEADPLPGRAVHQPGDPGRAVQPRVLAGQSAPPPGGEVELNIRIVPGGRAPPGCTSS
jgi:phenol hydroxylase P5 protein